MCCYAFYCLIISFVTVYHCIVLIHIIKLWSFIFYITESVVISRITRAAIATHINIKEKRTSINKSLYRYRERFKKSTQSDLGLSQPCFISQTIKCWTVLQLKTNRNSYAITQKMPFPRVTHNLGGWGQNFEAKAKVSWGRYQNVGLEAVVNISDLYSENCRHSASGNELCSFTLSLL